MDANLTMDANLAQEILRSNFLEYSPRILGTKPISERRANEIADFIHQQEPAAKIGRLVQQGITEVLPHTICKGEYQSPGCREVLKTEKHGCVLMYYCKEAGDANRAAHT